MVTPKYHIFVCTSCRINGTQQGFCHTKGSVSLVQKFMEQIDELDLSSECIITNTGCFGICDKGPICVVYPEGVWYGGLDEQAVERCGNFNFSNLLKLISPLYDLNVDSHDAQEAERFFKGLNHCETL